MKVALLAPPWLSIPPNGTGGIENVIYTLAKGLRELNVDVEIFSIGTTKIEGIKNHFLYDSEQYEHLHKPMHQLAPIVLAHLQFAVNKIIEDGTFDIIHDHVNPLFSSLLFHNAHSNSHLPPVVQTLHGPPFMRDVDIQQGMPDDRIFYSQLGNSNKMFYIPISKSLMLSAPSGLGNKMLDPVHNAVNDNEIRFESSKKDYFITLARFAPYKGVHVAAKLCRELGHPLKMAGMIADISTPAQLQKEVSNSGSRYKDTADFTYYIEKVAPHLDKESGVDYIGNVQGVEKAQLLSQARALLFPIEWEEPFGLAVVESLLSGTPVVAMRRGAMPEIIIHGKNGFLANNESEFKKYMQRVDEIDPQACRDSAIDKFSTMQMSKNYLKRYNEAIKKAYN